MKRHPRCSPCVIGAWIVAMAGTSCSSRAPGDETNVQCVNHLEVPTYPIIANGARVTGAVRADVTLAAQGVVQSVALDVISGNAKGGPLLFPSVDRAMKLSTFDASCAGRTVRLIFDFEDPTRSGPEYDSQTIAFGFPNRFTISAPPPLINP